MLCFPGLEDTKGSHACSRLQEGSDAPNQYAASNHQMDAALIENTWDDGHGTDLPLMPKFASPVNQ